MNPVTENREVKRERGHRNLHIIPVALTIAVVVLLVSTVYINKVTNFDNKLSIVLSVPNELHLKRFEALKLKAKAVYIYDINEKKVIFAKNEEVQLPLASLQKVMTAVVATDNIPEYTVVTIPNDTIKKGESVAMVPGFKTGDRITLKNLLDYTLSRSLNEGASLIRTIESAHQNNNFENLHSNPPPSDFISLMNQKAKKLGMSQTYFLNETGLDESATVSGGYGSAKDMAILFEYTLSSHPEVLEATSYDTIKINTFEGEERSAKNTNILVKDIPRVLASKTGLTDLAGGNIVMVIDVGLAHPVILSVLGSTAEGRFTDMKQLIETTSEVLNLEP